MKKSFSVRSLGSLLIVLVVNHPTFASACTVCMGDPNTKSAGAINAAIFLMLGVIGGVLGLLVAFGISLMRRANAPLPPHLSLSESQPIGGYAEEN